MITGAVTLIAKVQNIPDFASIDQTLTIMQAESAIATRQTDKPEHREDQSGDEKHHSEH